MYSLCKFYVINEVISSEVIVRSYDLKCVLMC